MCRYENRGVRGVSDEPQTSHRVQVAKLGSPRRSQPPALPRALRWATAPKGHLVEASLQLVIEEGLGRGLQAEPREQGLLSK